MLGIDIFHSNITIFLVMDKARAVGEQYRRLLLSRQFATGKTAGFIRDRAEKFLRFARDYRGRTVRAGIGPWFAG